MPTLKVRRLLDSADDPQYSRPATDDDRVRWIQWDETFRDEPEFLTYLKKDEPELYDSVIQELSGLAIQARSHQWRDSEGGRPEQLIPGTPGSFSDRLDWATWVVMGGRGSGKSRTGGEAVREYALGREWHIDQPYMALIGKRLDDVRVNMVENTLLQIIPRNAVRKWNRGSCELWLTNGVYMRGFSSESPENIRGPNFVLAWGDEYASWVDANRSPAAEHTTLSNLRMGLREDDAGTWVPRLILTTTPKPVLGLRNIDPTDEMNPGLGIYDMPETVVSNMSTMANAHNLSPHFLKTVVEPLRGTRLFEQEVEGKLMGLAVGALWSPELLDQMRVPPVRESRRSDMLRRVVVGVDPSVNAGLSDECGIVVAGLGFDGNAYILEDCSVRAPASKWSRVVLDAARRWGADSIVVEANQGGELVADVLGRDDTHPRIREIHAKKGKRLRAEPVALVSDRGELKLAGEFPRLEHQMKTFIGNDDSREDSPDRLDAMVYAVLELKPTGGISNLITVKRSGYRR